MKMKWKLPVVLIVLLFIIALQTPSARASTGSIYDDYISLDTNMTVRDTSGECSQDVSTIYMSILMENPSFRSRWTSSSYDAEAHAVSTYYPGDGQKWVGFNFVADKNNNSLQFQSRFGESTPGVSIKNWDSLTDGSYYIHAQMQQDGCHFIADSGFSAGQVAYKVDSQYDMRLVFSTFPIAYPNDYNGVTIPDTLPVVQTPYITYSGSVDCGNDTLEYLEILQDGNIYAVPLNYTSDYSADWSYNLTDSSYTITVGCGNTLANSYASVTPMPPTSNDWVCNTIDDPHYCVLD